MSDVGILVGRFQVASLHTAHINIIEKVCAEHNEVIVFLGVSPLLSSFRNPLDMITRKKMIQTEFPNIIVSHVMDQKEDKFWVEELDRRIKELVPVGKVTLYGGRESFIKQYKPHGQFKCKELDLIESMSGTENREIVSNTVISSEDFRRGVIYGCRNRWKNSYQCTNIACLSENEELVLLGKKRGQHQWRFLGGFVDPSDESLEHAARREFTEETSHGEPTKMISLGSFRVDDWRYKNEPDKIMTAFFVTKLMFGPVTPGDDIEELRWIKLKDIHDCNTPLVSGHLILFNYLEQYIKGKSSDRK